MQLTGDRSVATGKPLSVRIVDVVAEREGVDPTEIEPPAYEPLYEVVDPEALETLFAPREDGTPRGSGRVTFEYCGYQIVVSGDGSVDVHDD